MFNTLISILRHLLSKNTEVKVYRKTDDYDSHIIDDLPLTIIRSEA